MIFRNVVVVTIIILDSCFQNILFSHETVLSPPKAAVTLRSGAVAKQLGSEEGSVAGDVTVGDTTVL